MTMLTKLLNLLKIKTAETTPIQVQEPVQSPKPVVKKAPVNTPVPKSPWPKSGNAKKRK